MVGQDIPLFAERVFLYDGDPSANGIVAYDAQHYRDYYDDVEFVEPSRLIDSLDNDLETEHLDILQEADGARFVIPDYQRYYSWEENQHQEFWEEVLQIIHLQPRGFELPPENYFGTIYVGQLDPRGTFEVIDGQQRLTTLTILLYRVQQHLVDLQDSVKGDLADLASHVVEDWLGELLFRTEGPRDVPFVEPNDHDQQFFEILFEEDEAEKLEAILELDTYDGRRSNAVIRREVVEEYGISDTTIEAYEVDEDTLDDDYVYFAESHRLIIEAAKFYDGKIVELLYENPTLETDVHRVHALVNITFFILRSFRIAEILFKGENRELRVNVFQELNDRGKDLSTTDKIKARIVSLFQDSDQYEVSDKLDIWESILENFNGKSERVEDFLVYFIAATENPESLTEARDNMLDLFRLNEVGNPVFPPQLTGQEEGSQFLTKLRRFSDRFTEIEHNDLSGGENPLEEEPRKRAEEIIRRLHDLNTSQWIPFVLYLYDDVSSTPGKSQFFRDVLKTVENITFRVSLTELNATVVDDTYIDATAAFQERKENGDLNTYDAGACRAILLDNVPDRRQLTGATFIQNLIREYDWQNNKTKQLFLKIVDEGFEDEETGMTRRELDDEISVELEHIFPVQFIRKWDADENPTAFDPYSWLDDFFFATTDPIDASETVLHDYIQTIKREDSAEISESDPAYDRLSRIIDQIESLFVRDIGNMMILVGGLNRSVQNKRFSVKLHAYHSNHPDDLNNRINNYFSHSNSDLSEETLDNLLTIDFPDGYDDTDTQNEVEEVFNGWWNINRLIERKVALIREILNSLEYSPGEREFDIQTEDIREEIINDIRNRCNQPT